jgi:hypothetical protein
LWHIAIPLETIMPDRPRTPPAPKKPSDTSTSPKPDKAVHKHPSETVHDDEPRRDDDDLSKILKSSNPEKKPTPGGQYTRDKTESSDKQDHTNKPATEKPK